MLSFIKRLFGDTPSTEAVSKSSNSAAPQLQPELPARSPVESALQSAPAAAGPRIDIPLKPILDRLPQALLSRVAQPPTGTETIALPITTAVSQLPRGVVRITFRELKQAASPGVFNASQDLDDAPVEVPLPEILSRLKPVYLARRAKQRSVKIPSDIAPVFSSRGPAGTGPQPTVAPVEPSLPKLGVSPEPRPSVAVPAAPPARATAPLTVASPKAPAMEPMPASVSAPKPGRPNGATPTKAASPALTKPGPAPMKEEPEPVRIPLVSLAKNWPEPVRRELVEANLGATVNVPFTELEAAMKRGKVVFSWKQVRFWMTPKPSADCAEHDALALELPLAVVTPLFLARCSNPGTQKRLTPTESIPDLFAGRKTHESTANGATVPPQTAECAPAPPSAAAPPMTDPLAIPMPQMAIHKLPSSTATNNVPPDKPAGARSTPLPTEVAQRACHLSGVSGALVATPDGLVISSQLPPSLKAEAVAGFLPEMYSRLSKYTQELHLGDPSQVELLVGNVPFQIYKTPHAYFAVLGRATESLPKLQLNALAHQLAARTN